jgi:hypothetical protein
MTPERRAKFTRFCLVAIVGSLVAVVGSVGAIRAIYANEFLVQQGWTALSLLGGAIVFFAWRRFSKSN